MTAANGLHPENNIETSPWRRCGNNVVHALTILARPAKLHPRRPWATPRQIVVGAAIVIAVVLFFILLIDAPVTRAVLRAPHWVTWPFNQITDYGKSGWVLWPLGLVFLALAALRPPLTRMSQALLAAVMVRVGFLFTAIALPGLFDAIIKRMIGRARPTVALAAGHVDPFLFRPFIWRADYASLPSGHATTAFSIMVAVSCLWPRARTVALVYAVAIALSRIIVLGHFASDVVAGAVVGTVGALLVRYYFALRRLGFSIGPDGTLHQLPGPSLRRVKAVARELLAP
jgi:membrane-associated phospholipid phosphatase